MTKHCVVVACGGSGGFVVSLVTLNSIGCTASICTTITNGGFSWTVKEVIGSLDEKWTKKEEEGC
jgi:hypothetical protein